MSDYPWQGRTAKYVVAEIDEIKRRWNQAESDNANLRQKLEQAEAENERVRQANLDVMMHFEDMKAAKEQAEARVAEVEEVVSEVRRFAQVYPKDTGILKIIDRIHGAAHRMAGGGS